MKWNVQALFTGEQDRMPIRDTLDLSEWEFQGNCPLRRPVEVEGEAVSAGGVVMLKAEVRYRFEAPCDRCLAPIVRDGCFRAEHILVTSAEDSDNDAFIVLENFQLNLDELVEDDLWLELPSKRLCREDCRGLCPHCGQDLNRGTCGCSSKAADPRLEVLKQWMNQ